MAKEPRILVVGAGIGGITLACKLQQQLGYENYVIYERNDSVGGTWYMNSYPGVGCDIESHFYSFSFNRNPNWSKVFSGGQEILEYIRETADKFGILDHIKLNTEVVTAQWIEGRSFWRVTLKDVKTGVTFTRDSEIFISAVGVFGKPRDCDIPGVEDFQGRIVHTAQWDHELELQGKKVAVIGNGCSAAQLVPSIAPYAKSLVQFQRSPQYFFETQNRQFSAAEKFLFKYLPLYDLWYRYSIYRESDAFHAYFVPDSHDQVEARNRMQQESLEYMRRTAPKKYWDMLTPDYPVGCKRRIFDTGYLASLNNDNVDLTTDRIDHFTEDSIVTKSGHQHQVEIICLATGYKVQEYLQPMEIIGRDGKSLQEYWKETGGAQAYKSSYVSGFPNFGIIFGPNSFPSNSSVIFTNEVTCEYLIKSMIQPILNNRFKVIEVKESAETVDTNHTQRMLGASVWSANCTNWNVNSNGKNTTNYYDFTHRFWSSRYRPKWSDFEIDGNIADSPLKSTTGIMVLATALALYIYI